MGLLNRWIEGVCRAFAPLSVVSGIEGSRLANMTTPDDIVAAAIIQSFAKDFDAWATLRWADIYTWDNNYSLPSPTLTNSSKEIVINIGFGKRELNSTDFDKRFRYPLDPASMTVNGISLGTSTAKTILAAWTKIESKVRAAEQQAESALRKMRNDEKKWNLAESLLGMKRNEFGALVPVVSAEGEG